MDINVLMRVFIWAVPVLFSIVIHEVSHGWMAYRLGDDTAKTMGRLTLNPVPHIDPMGTVILPLIMIIMGGPVFGWAKPVPFNPYNFNRNVNVRSGAMWVALAGPGSNLCLAFISSFIFVAVQKFFSGLPPLILTQLAQALIFIKGGIGLTPVATICSIMTWRIILAPWESLRNGSRVKPLAWSIWLRCVGRVALYAQSVEQTKPGGRSAGCGIAGTAARRPR